MGSEKEYEELTIVLDAESGDGYISRKPVPAGTVLSDTDYWSLCSPFNAQMHRLETDVAEDVEGMHRDLSETKASMSKEVSEAESRVNTKVSDAQSAMQKTEDSMNTAVEQMNKRLDANVTASTDAKADYAAELVDVGLDRTERCIPPQERQSVGNTVRLWRMGSPEQSWHLPVPMVIWVRCSQRPRCRLCWELNVKQENFWITGSRGRRITVSSTIVLPIC